jgi:RNA polymerase sigma-70 factor (ECF subfamily)
MAAETNETDLLEEMYRAHADTVYRYCLSQLGSASDAEDATSDTFVAALRAYRRTEVEPDRITPWLIHIARNLVIDHYRRRTRRYTLLERLFRQATERDPEVDIEASVVRRDELVSVLATMAKLRPRDRELVGLRLAGDLSYGRIGEVLGISEHAATVATHRAINRLRSLIEAER